MTPCHSLVHNVIISLSRQFYSNANKRHQSFDWQFYLEIVANLCRILNLTFHRMQTASLVAKAGHQQQLGHVLVTYINVQTEVMWRFISVLSSSLACTRVSFHFIKKNKKMKTIRVSYLMILRSWCWGWSSSQGQLVKTGQNRQQVNNPPCRQHFELFLCFYCASL